MFARARIRSCGLVPLRRGASVSRRVLVVGAGVAGLRCAETLRAGGFTGGVTVVGDEPHPPYERPALSKEVLAGTRASESTYLRRPAELADAGIELLVGRRVLRLDRGRAVLAGGAELRFDAVVLATGARARRLPALRGARVLRTLDDAVRLRDALRPRRRLAVVGAGFVGCEVASTALSLGVDVVLVDPASAPLRRALGSQVGRLVAARFRAAGAEVRLGVGAVRRDGGRLLLSDGTSLRCDEVLVGVGARPAGELLGVEGAPVDACGRTAVPGVHACGDVALWAGERAEHWTAAQAEGATVARTILGDATPHVPVPYVWSDVLGLRLQLVGSASGAVSVELDGGRDAFRARYADVEGRPVAVLLANRPAEVATARRELAAAA
jgi:3-phenylpropionate/trans-cinnamate dioxygenase ferredoxin reductase subunit